MNDVISSEDMQKVKAILKQHEVPTLIWNGDTIYDEDGNAVFCPGDKYYQVIIGATQMKEVWGGKMTIEEIAEIAHEINKAYCEAIGDHSQPEWENAPDWQRQSAINGVQFHFDNSDVTPEMCHNNWLAEKQIDGWTYGELKDPEKKTHPCCVPYSELPVEQKVKDYLFSAIVKLLKDM